MTDYENLSREDIYKAKTEVRQQRAEESFEQKMIALVRMQIMNSEMAEAAGRPARKPWHSEDRERIKKYAAAHE